MPTFDEQCTALDRLLAAITSGNTEAAAAVYDPAAVIWHSNDNAEQAVADNLRVLRWVHRTIEGIRYEEVRRTPMESGQVVQEHVLRGTVKGRPVEIVACLVVAFGEDGRITRLEEYLDSVQAAALR
jgi:ketosteroid isomerase-like protein